MNAVILGRTAAIMTNTMTIFDAEDLFDNDEF